MTFDVWNHIWRNQLYKDERVGVRDTHETTLAIKRLDWAWACQAAWLKPLAIEIAREMIHEISRESVIL